MEVKGSQHTGPWDTEVDVVIAGAGGAGLAAAIEAASAGAETVVFEKLGKIWDCSTALSGGEISFAGTDLQVKEGVKDSNDKFYEDLMEVGQWKNDQRLVEAYLRNQLDTYYWLTGLGVKWGRLNAASGMSVPRSHETDPLKLVNIMKRAAESKGAIVLFNAKLMGLLTDEERRVTGARVEELSGPIRVRARRGVVLATGGFSRDPKRLEAINPAFSKVTLISGLGHTGDGHRMTEELGAYMKDMEYLKPSYGVHVRGTSIAEVMLLFYIGAILVNRRGERFVDESISYRDIGMVSLDQPDGIGFQIFDQKIYEQGVKIAEKGKDITPSENCIIGLDAGRLALLVRANTVEELASQIAVPPGVVKETVEKYNGYVDRGKDLDFGRATLVGGIGKIVKIDTPPFYAYETKANFPATYGGIAVDEEMHVLTPQGKIPGLYAAGELVGGFHGASYHTGTSVGKSIIFGRIAGRNAAHGV